MCLRRLPEPGRLCRQRLSGRLCGHGREPDGERAGTRRAAEHCHRRWVDGGLDASLRTGRPSADQLHGHAGADAGAHHDHDGGGRDHHHDDAGSNDHDDDTVGHGHIPDQWVPRHRQRRCLPVRPGTYSAPLAGALQLWPYSNGYDIYPGGCADNDPATYSTPAPFSVSQGVTSPDTLQVYGVSVTAISAACPVTNLQVTATDTSSGCSAPNNGFSFSPVAGSSTVIAIPLGTFSLNVTGTAHGHTVTGTITLPQETGAPLPPQTVTLS